MRKLINVVKLRDMSDDRAVRREMALICVHARPESRDEILRLVNLFRAKVIDVASSHYTIEASGDTDKMKAFIGLLRPMGIKKIARTGTVALYREPKRGI